MTSLARRLAAPVTVLVTAGVLSGCFGKAQAPPSSSPSPSTTSTPAAPLKVRSVVTRVVGDLRPAAQKHLAAQAGAVVGTYLEAAFVRAGGPPAGARAFPGFTPEARALAQRHRDVLTGTSYAGASGVTPRHGTAYVNVVSPHGRAVGATVQVDLALSVTADGRTRPVAVSGRLLLTPTARGWRIFGFDLSQSGSRARSHR